MNLRWRTGIFLGTAPSSNEAYIGIASGNVVKTRSICRVVQESRWVSNLVLGITGTPMKPNPISDGQQDAEWVEESAKPHEHVELDVEMQAGRREDVQQAKEKANVRLKITKNDLDKYGFTPGCRKCKAIQDGRQLSGLVHSDECRYRLYAEYESHNDPKWVKARQEIGLDGDYTHPPVEQVEGPPGEIG